MQQRINLNAGINSTGYGVAASNILKKLHENNCGPMLWPIGKTSPQDDQAKIACEAAAARRSLYDGSEPCLRIWQQHNLAERYSKHFNTALTFFELDKLNEQEVNHINSVDMLFVASKWAKEIVDEHCKVDCKVLPMGVDTDIFKPAKSSQFEKDGIYRFFTTGKIEYRKGHDVLIKMFERAFGPEDKVELHIKWENPFLSPQESEDWERLYKTSILGNKIYFHKTQYQEEIASLMQQCDCGVYPARAEGFGLGILESIACGKPTITTNYSAQVGFAELAEADLIDTPNKEFAFDGKWFFGTGRWAEIGDREVDLFAQAMRHKYEAKELTNPNYENAIIEYNWDETFKTLAHHLKLTPTQQGR